MLKKIPNKGDHSNALSFDLNSLKVVVTFALKLLEINIYIMHWICLQDKLQTMWFKQHTNL